MTTIDLIIPLFLTLFPLTLSPGPANLLLASSGTSFGLRKTLPFMLGIYAIFALQSFVVGAGLAEIVFRFPSVLTVFQYAGAAYLVTLAYRFFRASALTAVDTGPVQSLGFREGAILELLNFKAFAVQAMMFSLFLDPSLPRWPQILFLTAFLLTLGGVSGLIWVVGGDILGRFWRSEQGAIWQGRVFGIILLIVAVWMMVRA